MLTVTIAQQKSYVGFREPVLYRLEIGSAIVDDGDRLYRIQRGFFERLLQHAASDELVELDADARQLVERHPTIFELFDAAERAMLSFATREI